MIALTKWDVVAYLFQVTPCSPAGGTRSGRSPYHLSELTAEVVGIGESGVQGYPCNRQIRGAQKAAAFFDPDLHVVGDRGESSYEVKIPQKGAFGLSGNRSQLGYREGPVTVTLHEADHLAQAVAMTARAVLLFGIAA